MEESKLLENLGFQVFKTIGEGSYGKVFLVQIPGSEIGIVAAKVIKNEDFLEREWEAAGVVENDPQNSSPFIIKNIAMKNFDKFTVILYEYANLRDFQRIVDSKINIPLPIVRAIMKQLFEGLRFVHSKGIVHRDIKSGNILLHNPPGTELVILKIADFGEAKVKQLNQRTELMTVAGTITYMSPELLLAKNVGQVKADAKVDIWSLGILLYRLVTHQWPYESQTINQFQAEVAILEFMKEQQRTGHLQRPPTIIDNNLWDLIVRMLSFNPINRISAAEALQH
ncbi:MAG: putative CAMK family protein kinase, partial [Streblomastix strix]